MSDRIILTVDENKAVELFKGIDEKKAREFIEIVKRAYNNKPDKKAIQELQKWLNEYPQIWRVVFDLSHVIEHNLIDHLVTDQAAQLAIKRNADQIRDDLGYDNSPVMEKLLIDNIVLAWLRWQWNEYQLVVFMGKGEIRMSVVEFWEKRLSAAQRRYLRACETLTRIRHLTSSRPAVQVNIANQGGQQVNVAGDVVKK
jgi:hypothetical protein